MTNLISTILTSWNFLLQERNHRNDARQIPTIIIHPSLQIEDERFKNSVNPGWVEPDLNYNLLLVIN